jgi:hypothetical protein
MKKIWIPALVSTLLMLGGCGGGTTYTQNTGSHYVYDFAVDTEGWQGGFANYTAGQEAGMHLRFGFTRLPAPLDESDGAVVLSGINRSGDLFMYMKNKITGLDANATYNLNFSVEFATNAPAGSAAGEGVYVKVGASGIEPKSVLDATGRYTMNIDKGSQTVGGQDMRIIGNFSNDTNSTDYRLKRLSTNTPFQVRTDENGSLWVIVGTDSGYEGETTIFYNQVDIEMAKTSE